MIKEREYEGKEDELLLPPDAGCEGEDIFYYDEEGTLTLAQPAKVFEIISLQKPCSLQALNGSWLIQFAPDNQVPFCPYIQGPMRIEMGDERLRISGDVYVEKVKGSEITFLPRRNWYPSFPKEKYRWYFRSLGVQYEKGILKFKFERHLWDTKTEEFVSTDKGWMQFKCSNRLPHSIVPSFRRKTIRMIGEAMIGGHHHDVVATKTSPRYRGCSVEVDVMTDRNWPGGAFSCDNDQRFTFNGVYGDAGMAFRAHTNEVNVPEDPLLTITELHDLLATHRRPLSPGDDTWRLWLLVGSRMDGTYGIMFDTGNPPHREGVVGFYDPTMLDWPDYRTPRIETSARGEKLGKVPLAFLRTLIHEAGHAFNLYHPKHDCHAVATGTSIMNQTGDVIGFASEDDPYPCNATMAFNDHNRTSLIHSPDPQVKPGWKEFGWGHGGEWCGVSEPVDALGLDVGMPVEAGLRLDMELPEEAHRGEFIVAKVSVTNVGDSSRQVTAALNLAEGDMRMTVTNPNSQANEISDVALICSDRRLVELQPGESMTGNVQLFYTNRGCTFDQPGRYVVQAALDVGDVKGSVVRSNPVDVLIRPATTEEERDLQRLTMDKGVGLSLAFGDFGANTAVQEKLTSVMDRFGDTDTGAACAMVLANSLARNFRDIRADRVIRAADEVEANRALDLALKGRDASTIASMANAVVSPRETMAPLLDQTQIRLKKARKGTYTKEDLMQAYKIFSDHLA